MSLDLRDALEQIHAFGRVVHLARQLGGSCAELQRARRDWVLTALSLRDQERRAREAERTHQAMLAWFASLGPARCERCGVRSETVEWTDDFRGWFHPVCAEAERAEVDA